MFVEPSYLPSLEEERERYLKHQNTDEDNGYAEHLLRKISVLDLENYKGGKALDFGCGHTPVLARLLKARGVNCVSYDPLFFADLELLDSSYNLITCIEVAEHFHSAFASFQLINRLLAPNGTLLLGTHFLEDSIQLSTWWYARDATHVGFFRRQTIDWLAKKFNWKSEYLSEQLCVLRKITN